MKKLILAIAFLGMSVAFVNAQTPAAPAQTTQTAPAKMDATNKTQSKLATGKKAGADGTVLKKDGTPDKRYKAKPAAQHLKKDGTPDKRFKGNKEAAPAAK